MNISIKSSDDLLKDIEDYKNTYYSENKKTFFFRKSQKMDCANKIANEFELSTLLSQTIFIIPNTNCVYLDYNIFKLYANPENYHSIVEHVIQLFEYCIINCGEFECHFNLNSFTITAAERYKYIIEMFCKECLKRETRYGHMLSKMYIYYSPGMIERFTTLFTHLIDPNIRNRFVIYSKDESEIKMKKLFAV
jgi:hypothetical protein